MEIPVIYWNDYTDEQIEDAIRRLASQMELQRGEYMINQAAQQELVRILTNRKVQTVVKGALDALGSDEENDL